jgi:DNA-binding MarR family transcriptional regulator
MSITAQQLLDALRIATPEGLTSKQVSAKLGITSYEASSRLSKLAAYGKIERTKSSLSRRKAHWRLKQAARA